MRTRSLLLLLLLGTTLALAGCDTAAIPDDDDDAVGDDDDDADDDDDVLEGPLCDGDEETQLRPSSWSIASHCKGAEPNYDLLFDDTVVHRIDLTIAADDYAASMADLEDILSGGGGGGPGGADVDETPLWVPVTVEYDGDTWSEVGMRYKGNSSLRSGYTSGVRKLPFRLSFDKFEDEHAELLDQRFHGFKKMTFSNGFKDDSLIRDKVGADIFREAGVPAARGSFARIYVDFGEGSVYFGLYTMIEDPSNKMLETQFGDDGGNLYKPDGQGATLAEYVEESMLKKTFEDEADFSDVQTLIEVLNGDRSDAAAWRSALEAVFDVDSFLTLLALNQAMVNWDSYGWMTHNYYLYADPSDDGRFVWFPWDLNESLLVNSGGPGGGGGGPGAGSDSVLLDEIDDGWPMIRFLLDDDVYGAQYRAELEAALLGAFEAVALEARMTAYHDLIAPFVVGAEGEAAPYTNLANSSEFEQSVDGGGGLTEHVADRHEAVVDALGL